MLIEFTATNFRSLQSRQTLSLVAGLGKEHAKKTLIPKEHDGLRLLRSAVIYGPNASGKSNLLRALAALKQLIEDTATKVQEGQRLNITPFLFDKRSAAQPTEFEIVFVADNNVRYHYACTLDQERVYKEWLVAYPNNRPQRWFEREYEVKTGKYTWWFGPNFKGERPERKVWQEFTRSNALFFSTAIQLNNDQLKPAFNWITQRLIVLTADLAWNPFLSLELLRQTAGVKKIMSYMRAADIDIDRLELVEEDQRFRVRTWHRQAGSKEDVALDIQDESDGTRKLFEFAGGWIRALEMGATLFVDELDRSLHPHMTRFLVELFHSAANKKYAQLVYTTHDTTLLDTDLQRRDQVWFMEKDKNRSSRLYSLIEYSPRKDEALERGYLKGRYGAIPVIGNLEG